MPQKKKKLYAFLYIFVSIAVFAIAILISSGTIYVLSQMGVSDVLSARIAGFVEGIIAAIAAGLVMFQLREGDKERARQNDIEEASFLLQYNQSFIQDSNMAEVESLLEAQAFYGKIGEIISEENRQKFVNYLVYLESLAPLIFRGILTLDHIDDLMAYRFFLAVNNQEVQKKELFVFPEYYRGCFKLYKTWAAYRREKDREIVSPEHALDKWERFPKYAAD